MYVKKISYTDYDGHKREEEFYFNLTKAECLTLEMGTSGGITKMINQLIAAQDIPELLKVYTDIVTKSYGEKSPDGKRFIKSKELTEAFMQTEAFSDFFVEISTNAKAASTFVNGIIPKDLDSITISGPINNENNIVPLQPGTVQ